MVLLGFLDQHTFFLSLSLLSFLGPGPFFSTFGPHMNHSSNSASFHIELSFGIFPLFLPLILLIITFRLERFGAASLAQIWQHSPYC